MASLLSIKVSPNRYEDFEVPNEVAIYVKQLEIALSNTNDTNITTNDSTNNDTNVTIDLTNTANININNNDVINFTNI